MRTTIHCGPPKTGTTALQQGLSAIRSNLRQEGILYPKLDRGANHKWLTPGFIPYDRLPKVLTRRYHLNLSAADVQRRSEIAWGLLRSSISSFSGPELVLSSGAFFHLRDLSDAMRLRSRLSEFNTETRFVLFVRDPADLYYSQVRHNATAYGTVKKYKPLLIHDFEMAIEEVFGSEIFLRKLESGSDVTSEFLSYFFEDFRNRPPTHVMQANRSLSNEAIQFLIDYRKRHFPRSFGRRVWQLEMVRDLLHEIDLQVVGTSNAGLHPEIATHIRASNPEASHWSDRYGIDFGRFPATESNVFDDDLLAPYNFSDICPVSNDRLAELTEQLMRRRSELHRRRFKYFLRSRRRLGR